MKVVKDLEVGYLIVLYSQKMLLFDLLGRKGLEELVIGLYLLFCLIKASTYRLFQLKKH